MASQPRTVQEIFNDYSGRRTAIVNALVHEFHKFYTFYDPEKDKLRLYAHPNEAWEVTLPAENIGAMLPEPPANIGISISSYNLNSRDWLPRIAARSDSWLISIAFYHGAWLNREERIRLFGLINTLPTVFEVVSQNEPIEGKLSGDSGSKS